jgi:hypothetical protein
MISAIWVATGIAEFAAEYADQAHWDTGRSSKRFGRAASRML